MLVEKHKPLQELCINTIIKHFDQFSFAYLSSTPLIPRRHFEFLQRIYSGTIAAKLAEGDNMKEEYLELVINKYAKEFDMEHFRLCDWDIVEYRIFEVAETIIKISMANDIAVGLLTNVVSHFKNVETLIFANTHCTDETLEAVGQFCPLIRSLDVSCCGLVSNEGIKHLCSDVNGVPTNNLLQSLNVNGTGIDDQGVAFCLEHMPSLEVLSYENIPRVMYSTHKNLDKNSLSKAKKYNLTALDFCYSSISSMNEHLVVCSILCPRVKSLHVSSLQNQEELDLCCNFDKLESVKLIGTNVMMLDAERLPINSFLEVRGNKLINLDLSSFSVSATVIARCCPKLKTLSLKDVTFENTREGTLSPLYYLTSFALDEPVFSHEETAKSTLSILSASPNLEVVRLQHGHEFSPEVNTAILKCSNRLRELDFSFSDVELPFLETILLTSTTLEILNIEYCTHISSMEYDTLIDMLCMTKGRVDIIWTDSASDYTYSDYDEEFFDEYDVFDDSDYGYGPCEDYDYDLFDYINDDSLEDI